MLLYEHLLIGLDSDPNELPHHDDGLVEAHIKRLSSGLYLKPEMIDNMLRIGFDELIGRNPDGYQEVNELHIAKLVGEAKSAENGVLAVFEGGDFDDDEAWDKLEVREAVIRQASLQMANEALIELAPAMLTDGDCSFINKWNLRAGGQSCKPR